MNLAACSAAESDRIGVIGHYPVPEVGYERTVFELPSWPGDDKYRITLSVTKIEARSCNDPPYLGSVEAHTLRDSNTHYYVLRVRRGRHLGRMAPCPLEPPSKVRVDGDLFVPYESSEPLVIYAPQGFSLTYSIVK
ncbi:ecotin family protein [Burkholderia latens]|uniref:ecotin family protein n=1 Tax=Burkholderia latens TaxID=488446 RepID=UPI003C7DE447